MKEYTEAEKDRRLKELESLVILEGVQKELIKLVGFVEEVIQTLIDTWKTV